jgi:probable rRNA maturation factor
MAYFQIDVVYDAVPRFVAAPWIRSVVSYTLSREKVRKAWQGILITDNRTIRRLNKQYLGQDTATDVIAFWTQDDRVAGRRTAYIGDLAVSIQRARQAARGLKIAWKQELARYLIHGTLHLLGYTDSKPAPKKRMTARQEQILEELIKRIRL